MNTEENFKNNIWWLLKELKKDEMSTLRSEYISFEYSTLKDSPSIEDQRRIIRFLEGAKAIKISRDLFPAPFNQAITGSIGASVYGIKPSGHLIELLQPTFNETYKLFETTTIKESDNSITSQVLANQKTSEQKLVCVLNTIKEEFELGTHSGWIDIPASDFSPCDVDRDKLSRIISKFTNKKIINQFIFIDSKETKDEEEYDYDVYRLFLPEDFSKKADDFTLSVLDPMGYAQLKKVTSSFEDMRLNPEKYQKQSKERAEHRKKRTQKMYAEIDYTDPVEKIAWGLKWNLVQKLWLVYTSNSKEMTIRIPITDITQIMSITEIRGILNGLKEEGCFNEWQTYQGNYDIYLIEDKTFSETYKNIKNVYDRFNTKNDLEHSEKDNQTSKNKDVINIKSLSFNKNTGDFIFNKVKGNLTPKSQEFHFIKTILESKDKQADYATLISKIWDGKPNSKSARNDLNIIVRNVKQKLLILPKTKSKNPDILKSVKNLGYRIIIPK